MAMQTAFKFNANELFSTLGNMIISQDVFGDNIADKTNELLNKFRVDGSMYGDTKLYYATDVLKSVKWVQDSADALNLLATHRPNDPKVQSICIDAFRQIRLTTDAYITKRGFADEFSFSKFTNVMIGWLGDTKYIYDYALIHAYVGTEETSIGKQSKTVTLNSSISDLESRARYNAGEIAQALADLLVDVADQGESVKYNDYGFRRKYNIGDLVPIWNAAAYNEIKKIDLPTIFHKDGLVDKMADAYVMPQHYFGVRLTSDNISNYEASTPTEGKPIDSDDMSYTPGTDNANGKVCTLAEIDGLVVNSTTYHLFPGDEIPAGTILSASADDLDNGTLLYTNLYIVDDSILFKLVHKNAIKYMSAFETQSEFWNPKNLSTNKYLTFGYSDPFNNAGSEGGIRLLNYPFITVRKA